MLLLCTSCSPRIFSLFRFPQPDRCTEREPPQRHVHILECTHLFFSRSHICSGCADVLKEEHCHTHAHILESIYLCFCLATFPQAADMCRQKSGVSHLHTCRNPCFLVLLLDHIFSGCPDALLWNPFILCSHFLRPIQFGNMYTAYTSCS